MRALVGMSVGDTYVRLLDGFKKKRLKLSSVQILSTLVSANIISHTSTAIQLVGLLSFHRVARAERVC
jgi:hypothetical protein